MQSITDQDKFFEACKNGMLNISDLNFFKENKEVIYEAFCIASENGQKKTLKLILENANLSRLEKDQLAAKAFVRCYEANNFSALSDLKNVTKSISLKDKMTLLAAERKGSTDNISEKQKEEVNRTFDTFIKAMQIMIEKANSKESSQLFAPKKRRPGPRSEPSIKR